MKPLGKKSAAIRLPENTAFERMAATATINREEPLRLTEVRDLLAR